MLYSFLCRSEPGVSRIDYLKGQETRLEHQI